MRDHNLALKNRKADKPLCDDISKGKQEGSEECVVRARRCLRLPFPEVADAEIYQNLKKGLTILRKPKKTGDNETVIGSRKDAGWLSNRIENAEKANRRNRMNQKLTSRIDGKLVAYATLAGAALAAPAIPNADATIISSGPVSINIPSTTQGVYLNVVSGAFSTSASSIGGPPSWDVNVWQSTALSFFNPAAPSGGVYVIGGGTGSSVANLPFGTLISAASTYGSGSGSTTGLFPLALNSSNNLFGFRFVDPSLNGGAVTYGWMRISLGATSGAQPRAIVEYAYEDSVGVGIAAGVPEPTTVALLGVMAAGALGVRAWRKRKAA